MTANTAAHPMLSMSALEVRHLINKKIMETNGQTSPVYKTVDQVIQNDDRETPIRIYYPTKEGNCPTILMVHGGAWVAGTIETHDNLARYFSKELNAVVVSVGYTNSPEAKHTKILEQCYDALTWVTQNKSLLRANNTVTLIGDSAGGNIVPALALMAHDRNGPKIENLVLINPAPDLTCGGTIEQQGDALDIMRWQAKHYVGNSQDLNHPYVSPICSKNLRNLPPTMVILAEKDELYQDGLNFAKKLLQEKAPTKVFTQEGVGHLAGNAARVSDVALPSLKKAVEHLKNQLSKN